jgi:RNA polymerase sigma factor (TIGR02999 family)
VDLARARAAAKRGDGTLHVDLDAEAIPVEGRDDDFVALDEALSLLAATDARKAQVVEMRFFGGMTVEETAEALAVSPETVKRDWSLARAWLKRQLTA